MCDAKVLTINFKYKKVVLASIYYIVMLVLIFRLANKRVE
jgi:hypothetical protein